MTGTKARILKLAETGSTNADAMRLALAGEDLPLWVAADRQTAGRGRAGRSWVSGVDNVQVSAAFVSRAPLSLAGQLSLVAGLAAYDAIAATTDLAQNVRLRLKWPNDLLIGGAKVAGILVESTAQRGAPGFLAIVGFGINVGSHPRDTERPATSLATHGAATSVDDLISALTVHLPVWLERWKDGDGFSDLARLWAERAGPIGEPIVVNTTRGRVTAIYKGLSARGGLLAEADGREFEVTHGDVLLGGEGSGTGVE